MITGEKSAYNRAYYARNRDKILAASRMYGAKNKGRRRAYRKAYRAQNRDRLLAESRAYREKHPLAGRRYRWAASGLDLALAEATIRAHDGTCDVCGNLKAGGRGGWHVDHNHTTKLVRGVLCARCNLALGHIERVGVAVFERYLKKHSQA